jgi:hypothetical protein
MGGPHACQWATSSPRPRGRRPSRAPNTRMGPWLERVSVGGAMGSNPPRRRERLQRPPERSFTEGACQHRCRRGTHRGSSPRGVGRSELALLQDLCHRLAHLGEREQPAGRMRPGPGPLSQDQALPGSLPGGRIPPDHAFTIRMSRFRIVEYCRSSDTGYRVRCRDKRRPSVDFRHP